MIQYLRKTICLFFGAAALVSLSPSSAKAQHIVTEMEAGKLTLASLTSAPVARSHYVSRHHSNVRKVSYSTSSKNRHARMLTRVSYKHKASSRLSVKNAVYNVSAHKKVNKRRNRS